MYDAVLRSASLTLLVFIGIAASLGGILFIADPSGGSLGLSASLLEGTLFSNYLIPGFLLLWIIGLGNLITAVTVLQTSPWFPFLVAVDGCSITIWILVQMVMIQIVVPHQFVIAVIGLVLIALGVLQWESPQRVPKK